MKVDTLKDVINQVNTIYWYLGFKVITVHMDVHFGPLRYGLADMKIHLKLPYPNDPVPDIKHIILFLKYHLLTISNTLSFKIIPYLIMS